jgi:hypothetical protein
VVSLFKVHKMAKYSFSFDENNRIIITDDATNKVKDKLTLIDHVEHAHAFKVLTQGRKADAKASDVAISLLRDVLDNPRLEGYKGKTPVNEPVPNVLKSALRELEVETFKPEFMDALIQKGQTQAQADQAWQEFKGNELNTGSYSNVKSHVVKMFAYMGQLPIAPNGKLLPLHAIKRMIEDFMQAKENPDNEGISSRLVTLASALDKRTEATKLGDYPSAIAALKSMLATYEGLYRESLERLTDAIGNPDIGQVASAAIAKASEVPSVDSLEAQWLNGQLSDADYALKMLTFHNVQIEFEEAPL